ncbi:MAG: hypothetical protein ABGY42_17830 [bacterium]
MRMRTKVKSRRSAAGLALRAVRGLFGIVFVILLLALAPAAFGAEEAEPAGEVPGSVASVAQGENRCGQPTTVEELLIMAG